MDRAREPDCIAVFGDWCIRVMKFVMRTGELPMRLITRLPGTHGPLVLVPKRCGNTVEFLASLRLNERDDAVSDFWHAKCHAWISAFWDVEDDDLTLVGQFASPQGEAELLTAGRFIECFGQLEDTAKSHPSRQ
jgi:hypothetical protein